MKFLSLLGPVCALLALGGAAVAQTATTPGTPTAPYPTARNITIEWPIIGDDNNNGIVSVRYRRSSSAPWLDTMPLQRIPAGGNGTQSWGNRHSGSVFDLQPATPYDIELSLADADGGSATQLLTVTTRALPSNPKNPNRVDVTPQSLSAALANASPGDVLILQAGSYPGFTVNRDGQPGNPIVIRGTENAVVNGEVGLFFRQDVHLEDLHVEGRIRFNGSNRIAIQRCRVRASPSDFGGDGIVTFLRAEHAYIADNVLIGVSQWNEPSLGASGANRGEGIAVTGPGHLIEHNQISGFRDGISLLEDSGAVDQFSIDILENDIYQSLDDAIEADFCAHNCRIVRNRVTNSFVAFSAQPSLGGPTWFVRNVAYNVAHVAFKLYRNSVGDVLLHNTVVKQGDALGIYAGVPVSRLTTRNNLLLGGPGNTYNGFGSGRGDVIRIADLVMSSADLNFDALGSIDDSFMGRLGTDQFANLNELRALGQQAAGYQVDLTVFADDIVQPDDALVVYPAPQLDLAAAGQAIDMGQPLAGINDDFRGSAPDAGAYEFGQPLPTYGPRIAIDPDRLFADGFE